MAYSLRKKSEDAPAAEMMKKNKNKKFEETVKATTTTKAKTTKTTAVKKTTVTKAKAPAKTTAAAKAKAPAKKSTVAKAKEFKAEEPKELKTEKTMIKAPEKTAVAKAKTGTAKAPAKAKTAKAPAKKAAAPKTKPTKAAAPKKAAVAKKAPAPKKVSIEKSPAVSPLQLAFKFEKDDDLDAFENLSKAADAVVQNTHIYFDSESEEEEEMKKEKKFEKNMENFNNKKGSDGSFKDDFDEDFDKKQEFEKTFDNNEFKKFDSFKSLDKESKKEESVKADNNFSTVHSAYEAFTSKQPASTYNWNKTGSTYYKAEQEKEEDEELDFEAKPVEESTLSASNEIPKFATFPTFLHEKSKTIETVFDNINSNKNNNADSFNDKKNYSTPFNSSFKNGPSAFSSFATAPAPTVVANPFSFGFTPATVKDTATKETSNSHFKSVSSPISKLCDLAAQREQSSSLLPTSPFALLSKSPVMTEDKEGKEIREIILDDSKHQD